MFDGCLMQTYDFTKAPLKFLTQESCKAWLLVYQYLVPFNKITGEHFFNIVSNSLHSIITDVVVLFCVIDSDCKPVKIYFGLSHILKIATFDILPPVMLKWGGKSRLGSAITYKRQSIQELWYTNSDVLCSGSTGLLLYHTSQRLLFVMKSRIILYFVKSTLFS